MAHASRGILSMHCLFRLFFQGLVGLMWLVEAVTKLDAIQLMLNPLQ
jgi:hypothetical protein